MPLTPRDISFILDFETDIPIGPNAKLLDIKAHDICFIFNNGESTRTIDKELLNTLKILDKDTIEFKSYQDDETRKVYHFPTNHVTIQQFVDAVLDFEKVSRPKYSPGIFDPDHRFYEGAGLNEDGTYSISWGS